MAKLIPSEAGIALQDFVDSLQASIYCKESGTFAISYLAPDKPIKQASRMMTWRMRLTAALHLRCP